MSALRQVSRSQESDVLAGFVGQPFILDAGVCIDVSSIETREYCGGRHAVEAVVVIEDAHRFHRNMYLAIV